MFNKPIKRYYAIVDKTNGPDFPEVSTIKPISFTTQEKMIVGNSDGYSTYEEAWKVASEHCYHRGDI